MVVNAAYDEGMLGSVLAGLDAAEAAGADAVLLHPVDHPLVAPATVDRVVGGAARRGRVIAVPSHAAGAAIPAGSPARPGPALRAAPPSDGARGGPRGPPGMDRPREGDAGCVAGIDTPEDYRRLIGG